MPAIAVSHAASCATAADAHCRCQRRTTCRLPQPVASLNLLAQTRQAAAGPTPPATLPLHTTSRSSSQRLSLRRPCAHWRRLQLPQLCTVTSGAWGMARALTHLGVCHALCSNLLSLFATSCHSLPPQFGLPTLPQLCTVTSGTCGMAPCPCRASPSRRRRQQRRQGGRQGEWQGQGEGKRHSGLSACRRAPAASPAQRSGSLRCWSSPSSRLLQQRRFGGGRAYHTMRGVQGVPACHCSRPKG